MYSMGTSDDARAIEIEQDIDCKYDGDGTCPLCGNVGWIYDEQGIGDGPCAYCHPTEYAAIPDDAASDLADILFD